MRTPFTVRLIQSMPRTGWIALAIFVAITRYRHWGIYVAPLDGTATLHCTEVTPGDPLLVRDAEDLLFFGPELMGVL